MKDTITQSKSPKEQCLQSVPFKIMMYGIVPTTYTKKLLLMGCRLKVKLASLLSLSVGNYIEPQWNSGACRQMMLSIERRVDAGLAAAVRDKAAKEAEVLCASGQCAAAAVALKLAVDFGHLSSRALKAWMLIGGRKGVAQDWDGAFKLVQEGTRLGCHHCQGVLASCYLFCYRIRQDEAQSLKLARESSERGSRYGQYVLGKLYQYGAGGVAQDYIQAVALHRLAVAQNLDLAQCALGDMYANGIGVAQDHAEALRLYLLAAAQGHSISLYDVARYHEFGRCVPENEDEAIRWYRRAQAAGYLGAAADLRRLRA